MECKSDRVLKTHKKYRGRGRREKSTMKELDKDMTFLQDTLLSALVISESIEYSSLVEDIKSQFGTKSPVSCLTEIGQYLRTSVNYVQVGSPQGPSHSPKFTMNAVVGGTPYSRVQAGNKRDCRTGAAYLAWKAILQQQQQKFRDICNAASNASFHDLVTALSHLEYLKLVERNPSAFCGRKILATFLLKKRQKKGKKDTMRVVSLATGNRCILSQYLRTDGGVVNDSHAEVLARRALVRFLLKELDSFNPSSPEGIFELSEVTGKVRLNLNISLHLYISTAPCGDAALFSRTEREFVDYQGPIFMSSVHGLLRTKIESGEGAIPIDPEDVEQSLISLKFGKRLRTMSCSDKICKWNVLGVQGALLSQLLDPVYLNSVTIGNNYVFGHTARALNHRMGKDQAHYQPFVSLNLPYKVTQPVLGHSEIDKGVRETEHTSATCVAWNCGTDVIDIFDGVQGKSFEGPAEKRIPSISKRNIFNEFKRICAIKDRLNLLGQTYYESKQNAVDYQRAKLMLFTRLSELGYGLWLKKPIELDYFV